MVASLKMALALPGRRFHRRASNVIGDALLLDRPDAVPEEIKTITTPNGEISFYCLGNTPAWRAATLLTKEPETIEWIDRFDEGDVFWDIGANIGVYTLYAAIGRKARVLTFEPAAANYYLLSRNIEINSLSETVSAYCLAFSDRDMLSTLHMQNTEFGGALASFGTPVDHNGKAFTAKFKQGMIGFSVDGFIRTYDPPFPKHIKIDVDGIEDKIIHGAKATLSDSRLKSLSIELDDARPDYTGGIASQIEAGGLRFETKRHADMFEGGPYANIYNYQFRRD